MARVAQDVRAVFFDDQVHNFKDRHHCPRVRNVKSREGVAARAYAVDEDLADLVYRGAGLTEAALRSWHAALRASPHVKMAFFDWDRTLTSWDGLPANSARWIATARRNGTWMQIRRSLFGSDSRARAVAEILALLQPDGRAQIVTAQADGKSIKPVLRALAVDFGLPAVARVPVYGLRERGGVTKFRHFLRVLKQDCV